MTGDFPFEPVLRWESFIPIAVRPHPIKLKLCLPRYVNCDCGSWIKGGPMTAIAVGWRFEWYKGERITWCHLCLVQDNWGDYIDWASCDYFKGVGSCSFGCTEEPSCITSSFDPPLPVFEDEIDRLYEQRDQRSATPHGK